MKNLRTLRRKVNPVKISRTIKMVRVTENVSPMAYYPPHTHFPIDSNTEEAVLQSFRSWAYLGDTEKLLSELNGLRENLIIVEKEIG
ncbi:hypothetical protein GO009_05955 [Muricauda sp. TY007]|uniref:hypothetical protein n=1 Tax=Allomuricauda sp. TY007 TaxID=2683200 RepID=UPI0013BF71F1|nr:hypothetical protein [Muricauda sp. TY007]NDV15565.1 hypothetical protein [Muricauda sp. TY007]